LKDERGVSLAIPEEHFITLSGTRRKKKGVWIHLEGGGKEGREGAIVMA